MPSASSISCKGNGEKASVFVYPASRTAFAASTSCVGVSNSASSPYRFFSICPWSVVLRPSFAPGLLSPLLPFSLTPLLRVLPVRRIGPLPGVLDLQNALIEILLTAMHVRLGQKRTHLEYRDDRQEPNEQVDQCKEETDRPDKHRPVKYRR